MRKAILGTIAFAQVWEGLAISWYFAQVTLVYRIMRFSAPLILL